MADTITIGGSTYHKLVTFKDCASTENGGGGMFPWVFIDHDKTKDLNENEKVLSFNPKYFSELNTNKCISYNSITNAPIDVKSSYESVISLGDKIYHQLLNKVDLKYTSSKYPNIKGVCNYNAPVLTGQVLRIRIGVPDNDKEIIEWKAPTNGEVAYINTSIPLPVNNNDNFHFYIRISDVFTRFVWLSVEPQNTRADSFFNISGGGIKQSTSSYSDYVNCYNGGPVNYNLFWNICKLAELNGTPIYFTITIDN